MLILIFAMFILFLTKKTEASCSEYEFLYQGSECEECDSFIANCAECVSGQYSPIINRDFEEHIVTPGLDHEYFNSIPGWTAESGALIELNSVLFYSPQSGNQALQTAAYVNYSIYQMLTTEPGFSYEIQLYYSPFPSYSRDDMITHIYWGDSMDTLAEDGTDLSDTNWTLYTKSILATQYTTMIKIEGAGIPDTHGGSEIDNVSYKNFPRCSRCYSGYYLNQESCNSCSDFDPNCLTCDQECNTCKQRYALSNGTCFECPSRCIRCSEDILCEVCEDGYFLDNGSCYNCYHTCSKCESGTVCLECKDSFVLVSSSCVCSDRMYFTSQGCLPCSDFHKECDLCSSDEGCTMCFETFELQDGACIDKDTLDSGDDEAEETIGEESASDKEEETIEGYSPEEIGSSSVSVGMFLSFALSVFSGNLSNIWNFLNISMIVYYIPLMNTNMTKSMTNYCKGLGMSLIDLIPNFGTLVGLREEDYPETSSNLKQYGITTTSFVLNSGEFLSSFIICFVLILPLGIAYTIWRKTWITNILRQYRWNFFLRSWIQAYIEILFNSILSLSSVTEPKFHIEHIISFVICFFSCLFPFILLYSTIKHRETIRTKSIDSYSSLYEEFKRENTGCVLFYSVFLVRRLMFVLGIFVFQQNALVQVIINCFFCVSVIVYMIAYRPFLSKVEGTNCFVCEMCVTIVFIVSGLCLLESLESYRNILYYVIVSSILGVIACIFLLFICQVFSKIKGKCREKKGYTVRPYVDTTQIITKPSYRHHSKVIIIE